MSMPWNIGHRGAPGLTGEDNTLRSFEAAISCGVDLVETDVRCTADGALICFHDAEIDGGHVSELSLAECRSRVSIAIPTFEEFVVFCHGRVGINVEVKEAGYEYPLLEVFASRDKSRPAIIKSFRDPAVEIFAEELDDVPVGYLVDTPEHKAYDEEGRRKVLSRAVELGASFISPWHGLADSAFLDAAASAGFDVVCWTVDQEQDMRRLIEAGIKGIVSNVPDRLAEVLKQY